VTYALLGSDAVHNFGDGIAIAAAFLQSTHLGLITSVAVLLHELPEELADYAVLRESKMPKRRSLWWLAIVQMTAGLGAAITLLGATLGTGRGIVLAIAGGTFIYIAVVELLPDVFRHGTRHDRLVALVGLLAGAALLALL
jgi:zinc and cadmium transporter